METHLERRALRALLCLPRTRARGQRGATPSQLREALCDKEEQPSDVCEVCGDQRSSPDDKILYCEVCNVCVHQRCYGVAGIPNGDWVCRPCEALVPISERRCGLCPETRGALKRTVAEPNASSAWCHLVCALHNPNSSIVDTARMEPIELGAFDARRAKLLKCEVCAQRGGAPTQCASRGCRVAFLASCAMEARFLFRWHIEQPPATKPRRAKKRGAEESDDAETVALQIFCAKHTRTDSAAAQGAAAGPRDKKKKGVRAKKATIKATATSSSAEKARTKRERDSRFRKRARRR